MNCQKGINTKLSPTNQKFKDKLENKLPEEDQKSHNKNAISTDQKPEKVSKEINMDFDSDNEELNEDLSNDNLEFNSENGKIENAENQENEI